MNKPNDTRIRPENGFLFLATLFLFTFTCSLSAQKGTNSYQIKTLVIDPGHGGKDPGALGTGRYKDTEADVALAVGLKLRDYVNEYFPGIKVIMTRETDIFIPLHIRSKMANKANADLFISIHCNSNNNAAAYGSETYILGLDKTKAQMDVAKRENQVIFLEEGYQETYEGFDPNSIESLIALSMMQGVYLDRSATLAGNIQSQFKERVKRRDRGVKQAGFWVISRTSMPAVLIELGFVTNPTEEDFLNSEVGRTYMSSAIYRAFKSYKETYEVHDSVQVPLRIEGEQVGDEQKVMKELPTNDELFFRVQIASSSSKLPLEPYNFNGLEGVSEMENDGVYKYTVGNEPDFETAVKLQREIRTNAYKDAFIIAIYKGKRISLQEAFEMLKSDS